MELQAIRYAAMVSSMTLDQAIAAYSRMLAKPDSDAMARREIFEFLELDSAEESELTGDVRIVLVSADFSTELTTSVMWLNRYGVDITCIRLKPYKMGEELLVDVTQIIPLPEAAAYEVKVRAQAQEIRKVRSARQELFRRFWSQYIERSKSKTDLYATRGASSLHWISAGIGRTGFSLNAAVTEDRSRVECYIRIGKDSDAKNKAAFRALREKKAEIEEAFGGPLDWQDLPDRIGCRISKDIGGGWKLPEVDWPALQDRILTQMINLEASLRAPILGSK